MVTFLDVWSCLSLHWSAETLPPSLIVASRGADWFEAVVSLVRCRLAHRVLLAPLPTPVVWQQTKAWHKRIIQFKERHRGREDLQYYSELAVLSNNADKHIKLDAGLLPGHPPTLAEVVYQDGTLRWR